RVRTGPRVRRPRRDPRESRCARRVLGRPGSRGLRPPKLMALLEVTNLTAHYGTSQALFGMAFTVEPGQCITLLGRNGMGKPTTVNSIIGILRTHRGDVRFAGDAIGHWPSYRIAQAGIGLVPEMRQIFPTLTVRENLVATARVLKTAPAPPWGLERVFTL